MRIINEFDVRGTTHQFCMYGLFGVRTCCKWALESDSPWLMWTRIPYSARIGLPVRQYVGEATRKPILQVRKKTEKKRTERYGIPNFHRFRKSLATSSSRGDDKGDTLQLHKAFTKVRASSMPMHSRRYIINNKILYLLAFMHAAKATIEETNCNCTRHVPRRLPRPCPCTTSVIKTNQQQ